MTGRPPKNSHTRLGGNITYNARVDRIFSGREDLIGVGSPLKGI